MTTGQFAGKYWKLVFIRDGVVVGVVVKSVERYDPSENQGDKVGSNTDSAYDESLMI